MATSAQMTIGPTLHSRFVGCPLRPYSVLDSNAFFICPFDTLIIGTKTLLLY